jgi:hypothetical protein
MGAFGYIGTRDLFFDAQQPACPTGLLGLWGLGCRGMRLGCLARARLSSTIFNGGIALLSADMILGEAEIVA